MSTRGWSPVVILTSSALAMLAGVAASGPSPLRTLLVVWFMAVCPGLATIGLLRLRDAWLEVALIPALSFSIDVIVAGVLSYAGLWSSATAIIILVAISVTGALAQDAVAGRLARHGAVS
jgi:hypothetical protein